jgi:hypothetical protein
MIAVHHIREVVHERVYRRRLGGIEMVSCKVLLLQVRG